MINHLNKGEGINVTDLLAMDQPYSLLSQDLFEGLGEELALPDHGQEVKRLADHYPGGAFDPRDLENIPVQRLGYRAKWISLRFPYYGLDWDITGLKLKSLHPEANHLPWVVIIHGGSANFYEFYVTPLNEAGLGQYLAQRMNVMLCSIPGNFKYGGWVEPSAMRRAQYVLDREIPEEEVKVRNSIYTMKMVFEGIKHLVTRETKGDILWVGHSTGGDLAFLAMADPDMAIRLRGRFLGWGSGGPSCLRREWEQSSKKWGKKLKKLSGYPKLWELRSRDASGYVDSGYIGPFNPCGGPGKEPLQVAQYWLSLEERRRPNFKQVLQDLEHSGAIALREKIETEMKEGLSFARFPIEAQKVSEDLFATDQSPLIGYDKMVWTVGKWDKGHWHKTDIAKAREFRMANQFRQRNPKAKIRVMVFDLPITHYGHIEKPRQLAGAITAATGWLVSNTSGERNV